MALAVAHAGVQAEVRVNPRGQAMSAVPLPVPPGIAQMAPSLALGYTDGAEQSLFGTGWTLQGLSLITRCPATRAVDGAARNVTGEPLDKLCLDGQRLIITNEQGAPAASQTNDALGLASGYREYRTERDAFSRIRAYGVASGDANNGPAYFRVWTKAGQEYEYGTNPGNAAANALVNAQGTTVPVVWAVSRIKDKAGNYIDFKYNQIDSVWGSGIAAGGATGHEWGIAEIQYTGNGANKPANKVTFEYESRPSTAAPGHDRAEAYQFQTKNVSTYRIKTVRTYVNSPNPEVLGPAAGAVAVSTFKISYERSARTGRSRVSAVAQCSGTSEAVCMPAHRFTYGDSSAPSFSANATFAAGPLRTEKLTDSTNAYGILTGDFNGDGRTDIIRWSNNPAENKAWGSTGGGGFGLATAFNITTDNLGKSDGCFTSLVADFNGDGLSDILRVGRAGCSPSDTRLYLSVGDGSFSQVTLAAQMDFQQARPNVTSTPTDCTPPQLVSPSAAMTSRPGTAAAPIIEPGFARLLSGGTTTNVTTSSSNVQPLAAGCTQYTRTAGKRFYVLDLNGDGVLDIVTTIAPAYVWNSGWGPIPDDQTHCLNYSEPCSHVWLGSASGSSMTFSELTTTNIVNSSLYNDPPGARLVHPYWATPDVADIDGDGLLDILAAFTGRWRSLGNGNFAASAVQDTSQLCGAPLDFNGDGRMDCLRPSASPTAQGITLSYGATSSGDIAQFNLKAVGDNLFNQDGSGRQVVGLVIDDFDGDGRADILRWGQVGSDNGIYLSNGDGSFRARSPAGLDAIARPLQSADLTTTFVMGDFLGDGTRQLLHLKHNPTATGDVVANTNQLYVNASVAPDLLVSAATPTGLVSTVVARVPLSDSGGRYINDRVLGISSSPIVNLQWPMRVVTTLDQGTGVARTGLDKNRSEFLYRGLRADRGGRGLLGFGEIRQQSPAPGNNTLTTVTEWQQQHPYTGTEKRIRTYRGGDLALAGATLTSSVGQVYCDRTSATAPTSATEDAPCSTVAKVARPYVYKRTETGTDPNGNVLPTVTTINTYNNWGDPLTITATTVGAFLGQNQTYTKITTNTVCEPDTAGCPNKIAGDNWILGRQTRSTVRSTAPDLRPLLAPSAGTSNNATAISGPGVPQ
ncbi:MAG TPA: FG-GAP-like repeat-containing protein [Aquabacterium sp.]|nr:FG-GAP-like repeat-containing protein [Aquabacterium sp.]